MNNEKYTQDTQAFVSGTTEMTEREMIKKVADTLLFLENQEELFHCDYLADSVLKLHDSFNAIMPVLKRTGRISIDALHNVRGVIDDLHCMLYVIYTTDEIHIVSEHSTDYQILEHHLNRVDQLCKTIVASVSDWDDYYSSQHIDDMNLISEAMDCVSYLLDCVTFIKNVFLERQFFAQDIFNSYSRRRAELRRISKEFRDSGPE